MTISIYGFWIIALSYKRFENLITPRPLINNISGLGVFTNGNTQEGPAKQGPPFLLRLAFDDMVAADA